MKEIEDCIIKSLMDIKTLYLRDKNTQYKNKKIDDEIWTKLKEAMSKNNYVSFDYLNYDKKFSSLHWTRAPAL